MILCHWKSPYGNFGDDLNPWLWRSLIPDLADLGDDTVMFTGVGSVLSSWLPRGRINVVLGSGAGYGTIPERTWQIYAVRGPLTAGVLGCRHSVPFGDPAVLIPLIEPAPITPDRKIVFVPHWETMYLCDWRKPCEEIGCELVNPCSDALTVIRAIAGARHVIAESLHAAIIADAFRVPWTPVVCTHTNSFKWNDWLSPLGLAYRPTVLSEFRYRTLVAAKDRMRTFLLNRGWITNQRPWFESKETIHRAHGRACLSLPQGITRLQTRRLQALLDGSSSCLSQEWLLKQCQDNLLSALECLRHEWGGVRKK